MPQFILADTDAQGYQALDDMGRGYVEAMMFTDEEIHTGTAYPQENGDPSEPRIEHPSCDDIAESTFSKVAARVAKFRAAAGMTIAHAIEHGDESDTEMQIGRDLWFTSQGHGVGFWDRDESTYGDAATRDALNAACNVLRLASDSSYVGDDGKIYL